MKTRWSIAKKQQNTKNNKEGGVMAQQPTEKAIQSGKHIGNVLRDEGVEYHFGLHGGHVMALLTGLGMAGLKMVHTSTSKAAHTPPMVTSNLPGNRPFPSASAAPAWGTPSPDLCNAGTPPRRSSI
jgi:hypothetical protein